MIYFLNKDFPLLNFLNIVFIFASSADPDGIRHTATFHIILKDFENASPRLNPLFHKP